VAASSRKASLATRDVVRSVTWAACLLAWPVLAVADGLEIDRTQDLAELVRNGRVAIGVDQDHGAYTLDASAVLPGRAHDLLRVALDYDRYASLGVPTLRESHMLAVTAETDVFYAWTWMSALGRSSKQYLRVRVRRDLARPGAAALEWTLAPRQAGWPYEQAPAFVRLDGFWYLQPIDDRVTYVRYYLSAVPDPTLPDAVVAWLVKRQLREGARAVIEALARAAGPGR
jgi:hypothetical protein